MTDLDNTSNSRVTGADAIASPISAPAVLLGTIPVSDEAGDKRMRSVYMVDQPSESVAAVGQASTEPFNMLSKLQFVDEPLTGRAHLCKPALVFITVDSFRKMIAAFAEQIDQEIKLERELHRIKQARELKEKELQKEQVRSFWTKAETLFHAMYERIKNERQ